MIWWSTRLCSRTTALPPVYGSGQKTPLATITPKLTWKISGVRSELLYLVVDWASLHSWNSTEQERFQDCPCDTQTICFLLFYRFPLSYHPSAPGRTDRWTPVMQNTQYKCCLWINVIWIFSFAKCWFVVPFYIFVFGMQKHRLMQTTCFKKTTTHTHNFHKHQENKEVNL